MKVVIFCGGFGTRMWPVSRKSNPKQFYPLIDGKSFFQLTISRFEKTFDPKDIFVSTESIYIDFVKAQAPQIPEENIILEPERKDNLAGVGLATAIIQKRFPSDVMLVSWSDHFIENVEEFLKAMQIAAIYAKETGLVVSVNEKPTYPSISNEWIKTGSVLDKIDDHEILKIEETIKRPEFEKAKELFETPGHLINTGYRAWRADVMMNFYKEFQPELYEGLVKIAEADGTPNFDEILKTEYSKFPKDSVEFGIFVNLDKDKSATIASDFGWRDAGTWELFWKASNKDNSGNVIEGTKVLEIVDAKDNLIVGSDGKAISIIGLSGIGVIDTKDGLLVTKLENSDKVKEVFGNLEEKNPDFVK